MRYELQRYTLQHLSGFLLLLLLIDKAYSEILHSSSEYKFDIDYGSGSGSGSTENVMQKDWRAHFWTRPWQMKKPLVGINKKQSLATYNNEFTEDDIKEFGAFDRHPCRRLCQQGQSLTCYYRLVVHNYQRLGPECNRCKYDEKACAEEGCIYGDGVATPVMAVNRMIPGPAIEVCENDTVVVDVLNYLNEDMTMHWHGIHMSRTPEMDGAPFVTQYPVQPGEVYRYAFEADRSGTVWYHSHMHWQRALGVAGSFVIRQTRQANRHAQLYDYDLIEHTLMVQDIIYNFNYERPRNILINGKGRNHLNTQPDNDARHRYERLRVSPNYRYRIRVISNGIFDCPIEFSVENHQMLIISTDGNDIVPVVADSFFMSSAERFDFVLTANQFASNYWIRVRGYADCATENLYQGAVLHYRGSTRNAIPFTALSQTQFGRSDIKEQIVVNAVQEFKEADTDQKNVVSTKDSTNVAIAALRSLFPLPWPRYTKFLTYYSSFSSRTQPNGDVFYQIDEITYQTPSVSLLQARNLYHEDSYFCNRSALLSSGQNCMRDNCRCTNVIRLPAYRPLEIVIANYMDSTHPWHAHGYTFRLVGQDVVGNVADLRRIQELDRRGLLKRTPADFPAVEKDTVQIPGRGYIIVRFISDNPGFWMYHCHIEPHVLQGMMAVMKIGENNQMKNIPPKVRC